MNFLDLMEELSYELKDKQDNVFSLINKDGRDDIVLIFNKNEKFIKGFVKNVKLIDCLDDIAHTYERYRQMLRDAKRFADLTHYDVV